MAACEEQLGICLRQLVRSICAGVGEQSIADAYAELCRTAPAITPAHKAQFCRFVANERRFAQARLLKYPFGEGEGALPGTHGKIACVRNERSDEAFAQFSRTRRGSKVYYVSGFVQACEAVWENMSEFCILPIESSSSGRLYSFYAMLDRYDLKICDTVRTEGTSGEGSTLFALVGRSISAATARSQVQRFEFSVVHSGAKTVGDIIEVLSALGGTLCFVGAEPLSYDDKQSRCYFTADFDSVSPVPLAIYLALEYSGYTPIGLYTVKK